MADRREVLLGKMPTADVIRFTGLASLFAIFLDATLAHGLLWENDPYWTYWVTKTFLLASVIGVGTAWAGIGAGRGAVVMAVHTLVLTVYYWSFAPVGLPSSAEWLDLEHTWITGVPVHFAVLYTGYVSALWLWRRRARGMAGQSVESTHAGTRALVTAIALVLLGGGIASAALADFPGVTWFLTRVLITIPLLMFWWSWAGRDATAAVGGAVFIALAWAAYGHFLGPSGLPGANLRIIGSNPPPATVRWLDYKELWLISLPIYLVVAAAILIAESRMTTGARPHARTVAPAAAIALVLGLSAFTVSPADRGQDATLSATGPVRVATVGGGAFQQGTGEITIRATDMGARVTPLPPHDRLVIDARVSTGGRTFEVSRTRPMVNDPLGRHTTWWGVGYHVEHHGRSGIGTRALPPIKSELAGFALGDLEIDGALVGTTVPIHVMTAEGGIPGRLELDLGDEDLAVPELPGGALRVIWPSFTGTVSSTPKYARYAGGGIVLVLVLGAVLGLSRRELIRAGT